MNSNQVDPERTYALIVGAEKYAAGQNWYVDGPASDARRFADLLRGRSVPDENIFLFISPLDENSNLLQKDGPVAKPATREPIYSAITDVLPRQSGALLYVYWAGHGVITAEGTRRLFYADASDANKLNLDLNSLLVCLRSDYLPGFAQQICIVDACANYIEAQQLATTLPTETFPAQRPNSERQQFVLLGARAGDLSMVVTKRKSGLFSEEVFKLLSAAPPSPWPPDMQTLTKQLQQQFADLRGMGETEQTPTYFWYRDWDSGEGTLGQPTAATQPQYVATPTAEGMELSFSDLADLVDRLLECASVNNQSKRETIVGQLRPPIKDNIIHSAATRFDIMNILTTCSNYPGGIAEFLRVVRFFEGESFAMKKLDAIATRLFEGS